MTIYNSVMIKQCPFCKKLIGQFNQASGNTFGGTHWTDGKSIYPMMDPKLSFVKTECCNNLININDLNQIDYIKLYPYDQDERTIKKETWENLQGYRNPDFDDYMNIVKSSSMSQEEEKIYRMHAWWAGNDRRRSYTSEEWRKSKLGNNESFRRYLLSHNEMSANEKDNLNKIFNLLDNHNQKELLTKAEIKRELGDFDESRRLLDHVSDSSLSKYIFFIRELCNKGDDIVCEISDYF